MKAQGYPRYWDERIETMPREELKKLQDKHLQETVKRAYNCEFYKSKFKEVGAEPGDIKTVEDLSGLPLISKDDDFRRDLEDHPPFGSYTCVPMEEVCHLHATSGTTGKPTAILLTGNDINLVGERAARIFWSYGVRPGDIVQSSYTYQLFVGAWSVHWGSVKIGATVIPAGGGNTERQLTTMRNFGTTVFAATPSYCQYVAETAPGYGFDMKRDSKVHTLIMSGEPGASIPSVKEKLETAWRAKGYDCPGSSEAVLWSGTCQEQIGCHVAEDHFILEVLDLETKKPVGPGQQGVAVLTTLGIEGQPLIRFRTDDLTMYTEEACPCGRTHVVLPHGITGRVDHMMKVSGIRIWPTAIESTLRSIAGVGEEFRIIINESNVSETGMAYVLKKLKLKVEKASGVEDDIALAQEIINHFKATFNLNPEVEIVPPKTYKRFEFKALRIVDERTKAKRE
jgi:phenylacetate-CoA ligase